MNYGIKKTKEKTIRPSEENNMPSFGTIHFDESKKVGNNRIQTKESDR